MVTIIDPHIKREGGYHIHEASGSLALLINQLVNQSIIRSSSQSVNQSINQLVKQSVNHLHSQSISQSVSQSVNQSIMTINHRSVSQAVMQNDSLLVLSPPFSQLANSPCPSAILSVSLSIHPLVRE